MQIEIKGNKIYSPLKKEWVPNNPEEKLKQEFICRLINNYGYSLAQLGQDVEIKKRYKADIAIWRSEKEKIKNLIPSIIITVECKAEHIKIKEEDYSLGYNFATTINANFFIAVNLLETKVFHIIKDNSPKQLEKLIDLPKAEIILNDKRIEKYIKDTKAFTRDEFSKLLSRCHNIIRNNDKLSPEAAFDEISKVLFMKIMFERESKEEIIFSKEKFITDEKQYELLIRPELKKESSPLDQDYMQFLFGKTKSKFENDGIFEPKDQIKIKRNSFEMIVEELESFNLSDTSDDIKGIAFEQFLGRTFRGELGQFFTPRTIVEYMIEILDPKEGELICDPCCGSGGFLITAFEAIRNKINEDIKQKIIEIRAKFYNSEFHKLPIKKQKNIDSLVQDYLEKFDSEFDLNNPKSRYYKLSHDYIFGTDANPRMARTAKMNMIMHGDGHGGVHHHDGLININGIFDERFDIILTNPPFGARVEKSLRVTTDDLINKNDSEYYISKYGTSYEEKVLKPLKDWASFDNGKDKPIGKSLLEIFKLGSISGLTEVLFLERCLNLLKPGGRMAIVLPEGILNNPKMQKIRDFIESNAKILNITSIPQDVFIASGATVKPSLLFFKKFTKEEVLKFGKIKEKATTLTNKKHKKELTTITDQLKVRGLSLENKKELKIKQNQLLVLIENEIKLEVKNKFDYEIPVVEVEKAGISSTGSPIENELIPVAEEFKKYRIKNKLWEDYILTYQYNVYNDKFQRVMAEGEPEVFYQHSATK